MILMMMLRRRSSRDMPLIGRRLLRSTGPDRDQDILLASPPPLTNRAKPVWTPTMMMMMVSGLLQEVARLLEVMMLIGRASKKRSEFVGLSYFLLFFVLYAKGGEN